MTRDYQEAQRLMATLSDSYYVGTALKWESPYVVLNIGIAHEIKVIFAYINK